LLCACDAPAVRIEVATPSADGVELGVPIVEPAAALVSMARRGPLRYELMVRAREPIEISSDGACPREIDVRTLGATPQDRFVRLEPLAVVEGERRQIGYGARFELRASSPCAEVGWAEVDRIDELAIEGSVVRGRMPSMEEAGAVPTGRGIVPVSPRTSGMRAIDLVIDRGERSRRRIVLSAAARATGVPSVGAHTSIYLALDAPSDTPLAIARAPDGSQASLQVVAPGIARFEPDVRGRYIFGSGAAYGFSIFAGSHSETPLDCGRSECHATEARAAAASPMTTVLSRLLEVESYTPGCAIGCHAAGEPGLDDGGFADVAAELGTALPMQGEAGAYERLPRELRRASGVTCTTCHGPGAIPEAGARDRILATGVCATCHDAPPEYGHVVAWRGTEMSERDDDPRLGEAPCARCHTTDGFADVSLERRAAEITCAACHAVHSEASGPALTRVVPIADEIEGPLATGASRVCVACHSPDPSLDLPSASAVALVTGLFSFGADTPSPHATLERGCLACHGTETSDLARGASHSFGVAPNVCARCHEDSVAEPADLRERIARLAARVEPGSLARDRAAPGSWPTDAAGRARWNAALLVHDEAAWAHGAGHTAALLEATEALLGVQ
jgi:hypothetical protein